MTDIVITYVDGLDPLWQKDYEEYVGRKILAKRFRDWGFLKYLFRGIEANMPFVGNVFLIVARESQVPAWVNRDKVRIVLHEDIIPAEFLPIFNASAIEMFIHNIPGLNEQYLYFNDDMYPILPSQETDFFRDGKPMIGFSKCFFRTSMFMKLTGVADDFARKALGKRRGLYFVRPQHICSPMLRSVCQKVYDQMEAEIRPTISRIRNQFTPNQYLFLDYMYYDGTAVSQRISKRHFSLAVNNAEKVCAFLANPDRKLACINDVEMSEEKYVQLRDRIQVAFEERFPQKSAYEL